MDVSAVARLMGLRVRIPPGRHGCLSLVSVECCQVEVSATGRIPKQRSPAECGVTGYNLATLTTKKPWPTRAVKPWGKKDKHSRNAFVKNICCEDSLSHSLNGSLLNRNLEFLNTRFGSNYVLSIIEELFFHIHLDV